MKRNDPEHQGQVALFRWAAMMSNKHNELALLFAIPNGGKRGIITAAKMKAEGVKAGAPDMFLPVPALDFGKAYSGLLSPGVPSERRRAGIDAYYADYKAHVNGLFIELKAGKNDLTPAQRWWKACLEARGYAYVVAYSWTEAAKAICSYLNIEAEGL